MHLDPESELLQGEEHLDDLDWDYNEVEEDTGNEGATAERWYRYVHTIQVTLDYLIAA